MRKSDNSTPAPWNPPVRQNRQAGSQPTTIGGYTQAIAAALNHYGADAAAVFARAGVPLSLRNDPLKRLPFETVNRLFKACVNATGDPFFGLAVSKFIQLSNLHALGHALAASDTLMDFCKRVARYYRVVSQNSAVTVIEDGERILLRSDPLVEMCLETEDAFVGFLVLAMRQLYKPDFNPIAIAFHHRSPSSETQPYQDLFRAQVTFGAASTTLAFSKIDLMQPLIGACPDLASVHDKIANDVLAQLDKSDIVAAVKKRIAESLPLGECTRERIAREMAMSEATLQSRLTQRESSFQVLLDEIRKDLACSYLLQAKYNLTDIAFLLGFSDTSNFARAFRRWTGRSPMAFRRGDHGTSDTPHAHPGSSR